MTNTVFMRGSLVQPGLLLVGILADVSGIFQQRT